MNIQEVALASNDAEVMRCPGCNHLFSATENSRFALLFDLGRAASCVKCDRMFTDFYGFNVQVKESSAYALADEGIHNGEWFYATQDLHAIPAAPSGELPLLHLGTLETALAYARVETSLLGELDPQPWYIVQVSVKANAVIHSELEADSNDFFTHTGEMTEGWDVLRYVNAYDNPGSVSLVANPKFLSFVKDELILV